MTKERDIFVIEGIVHWAHVTKPNDLSGKYQVDLTVDEKTKSLLMGKGIKVKTADKDGDTRGEYVTAKKSAETADGERLLPPVIVDSKKRPLPVGTLIGNGSRIKASVTAFEYTFKGKRGKSLGLNAIQVIELVGFSRSALDGFKEEAGYEAQPQSFAVREQGTHKRSDATKVVKIKDDTAEDDFVDDDLSPFD